MKRGNIFTADQGLYAAAVTPGVRGVSIGILMHFPVLLHPMFLMLWPRYLASLSPSSQHQY